MRPHPIDNREALAKLPAITQRFWTWLTGLTHHAEPRRKPWTANQHLLAYAFVFVIAIGLTSWGSQTIYVIGRAALS